MNEDCGRAPVERRVRGLSNRWCLGRGREPKVEYWSDWMEQTGKEQADGSYICPECGRNLRLTSFGAGNGPMAFPPHKKPANVKLTGRGPES